MTASISRFRSKRLARHRGDSEESGFTLVELLVAMGIFSVLMSLALAVVIGLGRAAQRVTNVADSTDDLRIAFLTMDRQVRYADAVNFPGQTSGGVNGGDWWVEMRTSAVVLPELPVCSQWNYHAADGSLRVRTWTEGASPTTSWKTVARQVLPEGQPFTLVKAQGLQTQQELRVTLTSGRRDDAEGGRSGLDTRFVARNSGLNSPGNVDSNDDKVSDTPVCGVLATVRK